MRFHLPALPGQPTIAANSSCAYTQKVRRFATMMRDRGHDVFLYGGGGNDARASAYVDIYSAVGDGQPIPFDPAAWSPYNAAVTGSIAARIEPGDVILLIAGRCQEVIARAFPDHAAVEFGVGYGGSFANFRVFESYAWMHATYAAQDGPNIHDADGRFFDAVIPNYFDRAEFPAGDGDGDYLLFVGRMVTRKGVELASQVAEAAGLPLVLAGDGDLVPDYGEWVGPVGPVERARLMGGARALLAPTYYLEPFGGVVVEAQLCGTPAITTDWGAFPETVEQGVSGFRCRSMAEFLDAVAAAPTMDRQLIRRRALARYSLEAVGERYEAYFRRLQTLAGEGFYDRDWTKGLADPA